jgi:two-component sensor histidine kinase
MTEGDELFRKHECIGYIDLRVKSKAAVPLGLVVNELGLRLVSSLVEQPGSSLTLTREPRPSFTFNVEYGRVPAHDKGPAGTIFS